MASIFASGAAGGLVIVWIILYFVLLLPLAGVLAKAQRPAWAAFVPFYNYYVVLKTVGRPGWWLVLYFIPIVNIVIAIIVFYDMSKSFGHGVAFTVGLVLLSWIFLMILWLGSSTYRGPGAGSAVSGPALA